MSLNEVLSSFMFFLAAGAKFLGFDDFPIFLLICKAEAIVLPTFQISGGISRFRFFYVFVFDL